MLFTLYYCEFKISNIDVYLYKIHDDSVRSRQFLDANNKNKIEVILLDHEGHFLYKFINSDEAFCSVINFNLPMEILNAISLKLLDKQAKNTLCNAFRNVCLEIFSKWNKKSITIAESNDVKKISLHISTFGLRLPNITQIRVFTELVHKKLPEGCKEKVLLITLQINNYFSYE